MKTFALYAALAVLFDFILQVTAFVALLSIDTKRQEVSWLDTYLFDSHCSFQHL